jgi:hypothetical protein
LEYRAVLRKSQYDALLSLAIIMKHYNVAKIADAVNQLHWVECYAKRLEDKGDGVLVVSQYFIEKHVNPILNFCRDQCEAVPLRDTINRINGDLAAHVESGNMTNVELRMHIREVRKDIIRELEQETFIYVPKNNAREIMNSVEDWSIIMGHFHSVKTDVDHHHDCFAVEKNDASVFHLMRVVEWGLRAFCVHMGFRNIKSKIKASGKVEFTPIEYSVWEPMLNQIQKRVDSKLEKMKRGSAKQKAQEFYVPLLQDLRAFKDAWRNHVMHNRTSYTREDVLSVASHVRRFMLALAIRGICEV